MSPSLTGDGEDKSQSNSLLASSASLESVCENGSELKERNYIGLSDCSSVDSSTISTSNEDKDGCSLNLKATELRLGLPGSQSPDHGPVTFGTLDEKLLFPLHPSKELVTGNKRGFSDAIDRFSEGKVLPTANETSATKMKEAMLNNPVQQKPRATPEDVSNGVGTGNNFGSVPATKAQVVGWPPIRQFRKNPLASPPKKTEEVDGKAPPCTLFVKVSMDGAPYLRKVDLKTYSAYQELSSALEKMFSCFTIGQYGSQGAAGREMLSESILKDWLHASEYVLAYEDKDGDWMLVGDVPWEMFTDTCKRLRIMKGSDAIGLAPRAMEKCQNRH